MVLGRLLRGYTVKVEIEFPLTIGFIDFHEGYLFGRKLADALDIEIFELELKDSGISVDQYFQFEFYNDENEFNSRHDEIYPE